jgi:YbbR domain-containing protein
MKRWLFENLGLKAIALVVAVVLWAYVGSQQVLEQRATLQLTVADMPPGAALDTNVKTSIPVLLTGRKDSFKDLDLSALNVVVSLKGYQATPREIVVHPRVQPLPKGVLAEVPDLTLRLIPVSVTKEPLHPTKKGK